MKEQKIRLTESDVKNIIETAVRRIIAENTEEEWGNIFTKDGRAEWSNLGKSVAAGAKAGAAAMRGNYQAGKDKTALYGANANVDAEAQLRDINNACQELRKQYTQLLKKRQELEAYFSNKGLVNVTSKKFKGPDYSAASTAAPQTGRFNSGRRYSQADGNIGDLRTKGVGRGA